MRVVKYLLRFGANKPEVDKVCVCVCVCIYKKTKLELYAIVCRMCSIYVHIHIKFKIIATDTCKWWLKNWLTSGDPEDI